MSSAPVIPVLGGATVNRKWIYEVNTATVTAPVWTVIGGLTNSQLQPDAPNMVADTDQAGQGFESSTKTGATWSGQVTAKRAPQASAPTQYDVGQEFCRTSAIGKFGSANRIQVRVSEYDPNDPNGTSSPRVEAYTGFAAVSWVPSGGDMLAEDDVQITFQGQGQLSIIAHPYPVGATVPVIDSATPLALPVAGGPLVRINGRGFTGTTGITFVATAAPNFTVVNDGLIYVAAPAHAAGSGPIVVTNAAGPSTTGPTVTYS